MTDSAPLVCIVDDDEAVLKSLKRLLGAAGFDVETFASPLLFLDRAPPGAPGLCSPGSFHAGDGRTGRAQSHRRT